MRTPISQKVFPQDVLVSHAHRLFIHTIFFFLFCSPISQTVLDRDGDKLLIAVFINSLIESEVMPLNARGEHTCIESIIHCWGVRNLSNKTWVDKVDKSVSKYQAIKITSLDETHNYSNIISVHLCLRLRPLLMVCAYDSDQLIIKKTEQQKK